MSGRGDLGRTLAMFRHFAAGQRRAFLAALALLAIEAATAVYLPTLLGALINFLKDGRPWSVAGFSPGAGATIQALAITIVAATALNSLADSLAEISLAKAGRTLGYNLRITLFGHLQKLSLAFHLRRRTGDVLTRITGDVQALENFVVDSVSDLAGSFLLLAGTLAWLLYKSVQVALLALVIVPVLAVVSNYFARRIKAASKVERAREGDLASSAQEMLSSVSVVQIYGRGDYEQGRFADRSRGAMDAVLRTARLEAAFGFTVSVLEAGVIAAVVWAGALLIHPAISSGLLITFILQIQNMFKPTRRIIKEWNTVGKVYASVERIGELLEREPAVDDLPDALPAPRFVGDIEFRDVSFAYQPGPDEVNGDGAPRLALNGLNFQVAAGDMVALIGHSGAGKSTIAQLVPRLYDPHVGSVLVDGWDVRQFTVDSLRAQIAMVLQETILFSGTVADNIAYGRPGAGRDDVVQAAQHAHAHEFITALPDGYDTVLGERAATLSGGQRQRLAIARAFIRDAPILILDEPTTGLDAGSAQAVLAALRTLVQGRSALIVSHDFKLIRTVDRILVLSAGRVLEEGTPADLLARGGLYAELYAREFGEPVAAPAAIPVDVADVEIPADLDLGPDVVSAGRRGQVTRDFERVLTAAVPRPASHATFRALTGRELARGQRPLEDADLDPMLSPALTRAVPGLAEALDADAMAPRLQGMLGPDWQLDWCTPGRAIVCPGEGVSLRYQLGLRQLSTGRTVERLVGGRLFASGELAARWLAHRVLPLAEQVDRREDLTAFGALGLLVEALRLVLHAFPVDPDRPGLLAATDPDALAHTLVETLGTAGEGLSLVECRPDVVHYDRYRCVLRYEVRWRLGATDRTLKQVVFGKVYADDHGTTVRPAIEAVLAHAQHGGARAFLVPRFRGYLPEPRLALLDAIPGTPRLTRLVRERIADAARDGAAGDALASCGQITATWHDIPADIGASVRSLRTEYDAACAEVAEIASLAPALAESLSGALVAVAGLRDDEPLPAVFAHGDLTPGQFLFDGPLRGLVDFDTTCRAEPALDLGRFTAHLAVSAGKAQTAARRADAGQTADLTSAFLSEYLHAAGVRDTAGWLVRTAAYRRVSLVRLAAMSWRQLKPARVRVAELLMDEDAMDAAVAASGANRTARARAVGDI
ncbi:MAG: ABC transporter transmembrane domain-containing protein [Jatrophihabitantaceae bacterium]